MTAEEISSSSTKTTQDRLDTANPGKRPPRIASNPGMKIARRAPTKKMSAIRQARGPSTKPYQWE